MLACIDTGQCSQCVCMGQDLMDLIPQTRQRMDWADAL
jgi:hypothetical protein